MTNEKKQRIIIYTLLAGLFVLTAMGEWVELVLYIVGTYLGAGIIVFDDDNK